MTSNMIAATDIGTLIERRPELRGGRPIVAGTGVSVHRIAGWYKLGLSPEEIVENYGHPSPRSTRRSRTTTPTGRRSRAISPRRRPMTSGCAAWRVQADQWRFCSTWTRTR
jgi:uncharacterized protein (DUF433 family)